MAEARESNVADEPDKNVAEMIKILAELEQSSTMQSFMPVDDSHCQIQKSHAEIVDQTLKDLNWTTYNPLSDDDCDSCYSDLNLEEMEMDEKLIDQLIGEDGEETEQKVQTSCEESLDKENQKRTKKPRKKRKNLEEPGSQLYQFLLMLLENSTMKDLIEWVDETNHLFRIKDKEKVAKMWGDKRGRPQEDDITTRKKAMTYKSLSRALRYYYQQDMMASVSEQLHYRFTDKCLKEWELTKKKFSDAAKGDCPKM